ncbi:hypothetical protein L1987_54650 [Smallanthus sonchifolius]|uniref:Uncharacterized protein n=1 Tax=Smallanthus sonchifolius TaxID=185202 RepID=A0ACB9E8D8_9ASTR|nr:hypothetical protein L1987_54650 [Smallanthus sonchifolius]
MARAFTNEFNLLAKTEPEWKGAALQYREIVDFLNRSRISYAISADPIVSRPYLEQFWETAEHDYMVTPNVIRATVAGHAIAFSEDSIRRVLQFRDLSTDRQPIQTTLWTTVGGKEWDMSVRETMLHIRRCGC